MRVYRGNIILETADSKTWHATQNNSEGTHSIRNLATQRDATPTGFR